MNTTIKTISIETLAEKINGKLWVKGDLKRIYLDCGFETLKNKIDMAYKTCENCGCRVYAQGCVNCDEMEYISMQEDYIPPKRVAKNLQQADVMRSVCQHPLKYKVENDVRWFCPDGCGYLYGQTDA